MNAETTPLNVNPRGLTPFRDFIVTKPTVATRAVLASKESPSAVSHK